jgi:hypothetical protein
LKIQRSKLSGVTTAATVSGQRDTSFFTPPETQSSLFFLGDWRANLGNGLEKLSAEFECLKYTGISDKGENTGESSESNEHRSYELARNR